MSKPIGFSAAMFIVAIPFMQLLTLNLGFPLKVSELAIICWLLGSTITQNIHIIDAKILTIGVITFIYSVAALFANLLMLSNEGAYGFLARFTPLLDGILKSIYVLLCVLAFNLSAVSVVYNRTRVFSLWLIGAQLSAIIQLIIFSFSALDLPLPAIPGMPDPPQYMDFAGMSLYRAATFLEGNYAGPFFTLSFLVALSLRRYASMALFLITAATTFSTGALLGLLAAIVYIFIMEKDIAKKAVVIGISAAVVLVSLPYLKVIIFEKLSDTGEYSSALDRTGSFLSAERLFLENPVIGIGIAQFGMHTPGTFGRDTEHASLMRPVKSIANNVYAEIAAELGIFGLIVLGTFIFYICKLAKNCSDDILKAGFIAIFVFWLSSPTITMMYYWAYFGLVCGVARQEELQKSVSGVVTAGPFSAVEL